MSKILTFNFPAQLSFTQPADPAQPWLAADTDEYELYMRFADAHHKAIITRETMQHLHHHQRDDFFAYHIRRMKRDISNLLVNSMTGKPDFAHQWGDIPGRCQTCGQIFPEREQHAHTAEECTELCKLRYFVFSELYDRRV